MDHARYLVALIAVLNVGGLLADAVVPTTARQHLFNPHWPPHAKFHNAQTILLGLMNGAIALFLLFGTGELTRPLFLAATFLASAYFAAMALAPSFPGTAWCDPEFAAEKRTVIGLKPQQAQAYAVCAAAAVAVVWGMVG